MVQGIKERIRTKSQSSESLDDVKKHLFEIFRDLKTEGYNKLGYVAGIITAEGPENMAKNLKRLEKFTDLVRSQNDFPIFSPTDIFDRALFAKLEANGFKNADWEVFFRQVLSGEGQHFVTDIFMTPKWEISHGSTDEHKTAKENGIEIHYLTDEIV